MRFEVLFITPTRPERNTPPPIEEGKKKQRLLILNKNFWGKSWEKPKPFGPKVYIRTHLILWLQNKGIDN